MESSPCSVLRLLDSPLRWAIRLTLTHEPTETGPDVLLGAFRRQPDRTRPAPDEEVSLRRDLNPFPLQKHWLRAALATHEADALAVHDLGLGIDAGACAISEPIAHNL